ncbi:MAG: methyl-accepting chemotaxis protein [Elusimicrobia bacterium]|nr:methyl-accepting chemotaxis protein [Elusimicrobiota bacterium]
MTAAAPKFQRRKVLVKHWLQFRYMSLVFFSVLLLCAIVWMDAYYTMLRMALGSNPGLSPLLFQFNDILIAKMLIYLAMILLISLYISHRFAGPIYRFEKSADIVASGDLTHRVSLRTGDELKELQDKFNAMLAALQSLVLKDRNLARRLSERLGAALQRLPRTSESRPVHDELESLGEDLKRLTESFKA